MLNSREKLGEFVKAQRETRGWTQDELVTRLAGKANRSAIAHLEQGLRLPKPEVLKAICDTLSIPTKYWLPFTQSESIQRLEFEQSLAELVGFSVTADGHDDETRIVVERQITELFEETGSVKQTLDRFNSVLVYYGVSEASQEFFEKYLTPNAFSSVSSFDTAVKVYQKDAVRLFSTLGEAYREFTKQGRLADLLKPIQSRTLHIYQDRNEWDVIEEIPDENLPDLGYVSAARVKQESAERQALKSFLDQLAKDVAKNGKGALESVPVKTKRKMDSLLRKFNSTIKHGLFSPLFAPDGDEIERESARLAPKTVDQLARMATTQATALRNLAYYLAADHMDVYVATSMRSDADFVSVNHFIRRLFTHDKIRPLKLRYFNPTQSWIDDRIAKGLVEALMLRRSDVTIYMAQKSDTFGKDSEASVALGQGKPVIVYVPKLVFPDGTVDAELLFKKGRADLINLLDASDKAEVDETVDDQALVSRILTAKLEKCTNEELAELAASTWADFDLHNEADRIEEAYRGDYRTWLDASIQGKSFTHDFSKFRAQVIGIFVANAVRFEIRARTFREIHPLALQVILSSGVLNGILVVRSVEQCAEILSALVSNQLQLDLEKDEHNYRLIEELTGSTIRVISRHRLLRHAFQTFYGRN